MFLTAMLNFFLRTESTILCIGGSSYVNPFITSTGCNSLKKYRNTVLFL